MVNEIGRESKFKRSWARKLAFAQRIYMEFGGFGNRLSQIEKVVGVAILSLKYLSYTIEFEI